MAISLYDTSIPNYLQVLGSITGVLEKGAEFARENNMDLAEIVETRLCPDMLPFQFQVISVWHHSLGAIKGIRKGVFTPPPSMPELDYAGLQGLVGDATEELRTVRREELDALEGNAMKFKMGDFEIPFIAENFILSFSLPNFYFHATTTYSILRMAGVPLGKMDFLGEMRADT
ncbi:MAG: DUF1993 domain-containing protein [Gammaproteobacteria bacterium]|nr:MAG: DUF1993 domain-containing protein [Gammaproteobacteria bacterium]RLA59645.1 MAG: DUF1993 domain-containing protein [Gammaproteobacteria bacterium]